MKTYKVKTEYGTIEGALGYNTYMVNDSLAVFILDNKSKEPFATITVCLPDEKVSNENCTFIDTNNCPWAEEFLEVNGIAKPTGNYGFSGFCGYPEYEFDMNVLNG